MLLAAFAAAVFAFLAFGWALARSSARRERAAERVFRARRVER